MLSRNSGNSDNAISLDILCCAFLRFLYPSPARVSPLFLVLRLFSVRSTRRIHEFQRNFNEFRRISARVAFVKSSLVKVPVARASAIKAGRLPASNGKIEKRNFSVSTIAAGIFLEIPWKPRGFGRFAFKVLSPARYSSSDVGSLARAQRQAACFRVSLSCPFSLSCFSNVQPFRSEITRFRNRRSPMGKFHGGKNRPDTENIDGRLGAARRTKIRY